MTGDAARVSVYVAVPPAAAWDVFTKETDLWWRQGPRFRIAGARRGLEGAAFARMIGLWWGDLLTALREHAASRTGTL